MTKGKGGEGKKEKWERQRGKSCGLGGALLAAWACSKGMFWHDYFAVCPSAYAGVFESVSRQRDGSVLMVIDTVSSPRHHLCACVCTHRFASANGVFASVGGKHNIPNWQWQYCIIWVTKRVSNVTKTGRGRDAKRGAERKSCLKTKRDLQ